MFNKMGSYMSSLSRILLLLAATLTHLIVRVAALLDSQKEGSRSVCARVALLLACWLLLCCGYYYFHCVSTDWETTYILG